MRKKREPREDEMAIMSEAADSLCEKRGVSDNRRLRFYLRARIGVPVLRAAKEVGFSESYGRKLLDQFRTNPKLRAQAAALCDHMVDDYRAATAALLGDVAEIDSKVVEKLKADPELAIRHPAYAKHIRQVVGAQATDVAVQTNVQINLESLQAMIQKDVSS